jgi:hypothetical protein
MQKTSFYWIAKEIRSQNATDLHFAIAVKLKTGLSATAHIKSKRSYFFYKKKPLQIVEAFDFVL